MYVWVLVCDNPNQPFEENRYTAYSFVSELEAQNALMEASKLCQGFHTIHQTVVEVNKCDDCGGIDNKHFLDCSTWSRNTTEEETV